MLELAGSEHKFGDRFGVRTRSDAFRKNPILLNAEPERGVRFSSVQRADNNTEGRMICCALESIPTRTFALPFASTAPSSPPSSPSSPSPNSTVGPHSRRSSCRSSTAAAAAFRVHEGVDTRAMLFATSRRLRAGAKTRGLPPRPPIRCSGARTVGAGSSSCRVHVRFIHVWEALLVLALRPRLGLSPQPSMIMRRITRSTPRIPCPGVAATPPAATPIRHAALPPWGRVQAPTAASEDAAVGALLRPPSPPASHSPLEYAFGARADPPRRPRLLGQDESDIFGLPNGLAPAPTGLFGLGLGFGCRSKPKPGRSACKPVCRLGKPVCSLSRETGLRVLLATKELSN
ncbi:hypothetical protein C8R45DRAFT_934162 [Mycena sanguinolenta]|nr:hypothetical protein C8R45DRAFT_934162 [Mycena sanguinolenta]